MTPFTWMFLPSYEYLRKYLLVNYSLMSLVKPEYHSFFESAFVPVCSFVLYKQSNNNYTGKFIDLSIFNGAEMQPIKALEAIKNPGCDWFYSVPLADFQKIPGFPIAFWASRRVREVFSTFDNLESHTTLRKGLVTGDNERFFRSWYEVAFNNTELHATSRESAKISEKKWFPIYKGGKFRKWFGNNEILINWQNDGYEIRNFVDENGSLRSRPQNLDFSFKKALTWSRISIGTFSARYCDGSFLFDDAGAICYSDDEKKLKSVLPILCSKIGTHFLRIINSTMSNQIGDLAKIPIRLLEGDALNLCLSNVDGAIRKAQMDWNFQETSWGFSEFPLLNKSLSSNLLFETYKALGQYWFDIVQEMKLLEEENNRIFIEAYSLQDELTPNVSLDEITLNCNRYFRYGGNKSEEQLDELLCADTMKEFISYAVGCMFGRYSLDKPGLILANAGGTADDYRRQVPEPSFPPDVDNAIPVLEGEWFEDDIVERFKKFLKITFGTEHYEENLAFIEEAIGRDIRSYFVKDFFNEHVKMYKKRPIYWMFSSPKGSFNVLMYIHRYRPDTISVILNNYLRQYREKLNAHKAHQESISRNPSASQSEKTKALKEAEWVKKVLAELKEYEDEILYPMAMQKIAIDLDDGVKVNYGKFGKALREIKGL
jgi:hypothetical protein